MRPQQSLSKLPDFVRTAMFNPGVLLVGSACKWLIGEKNEIPGDFDIIVEPSQFQAVCRTLSNTAVKVNSFGGLKIIGPPSIDIIPLTLTDFILQCDGDIAIALRPYKIVRW